MLSHAIAVCFCSVIVHASEAPSVQCPGDIDGNGTVNVQDLLEVIAGWGDPYDVDDLLGVISDWGCTSNLVPGDIKYFPQLGQKKYIVIRVKYPGDKQGVLSDEAAAWKSKQMIDGLEANSWGLLELEVDVTPEFVMPQDFSYYQGDGGLVRVREDAVAVAADAGFEIETYDKEIIATRETWNSAATGLGYQNYRTTYLAGGPGHLWTHEIGHAFSWYHASAWKVEAGQSPIDPGGLWLNYGDQFDMMGMQGIPWMPRDFGHFGPWLKWRAGWLEDSSIQEVTQSGTYTIQAIETPPTVNVPSALFVRCSPGAAYWIYHRSSEPLVSDGVVIQRVQPHGQVLDNEPLYGETLLLDMTPGSLPTQDGVIQDLLDPALLPGEVYWDPDAGIEIMTVSAGGGLAAVTVWVSEENPPGSLDRLPVLDVISPTRSVTQSGVINFEATAFDPDFDHVNGGGIAVVSLELVRVLEEAYDDPLATATLTEVPFTLEVDTIGLGAPDGKYRLFVTVQSEDGGLQRGHFLLFIDNPGGSSEP